MSKKDRRKTTKAGLIAGIAGFIAGLLLIRPGTPIGIAIIGGIGFAIGKSISVMTGDFDTTPKNAPGNRSIHYKAPETPVEELPLSGNENADQLIRNGQNMLERIRKQNTVISDAVLTAQMNELEDRCVQIFKTVSEKPEKAPQIRKFMNYYLPTTLKMLENYDTMSRRGLSRSSLSEAHDTVVKGMDMVLTACQKQIDHLYRSDMLDMSTDIDVLEKMLMRDGFTDAASQPDAENIAKNTGTAAVQQLKNSGAPILNVPDSRIDDDFIADYTANLRQKNGRDGN